MGKLSGKVALVTGASRGLGRATALELAQEGCYVICTGRSRRGHGTQPRLAQATLDDTLELVQAAGGQGEVQTCDHTDPAQVEALLAAVTAQHGPLDLLVNNAWGGHDVIDEKGRGKEVWDEPLPQLKNMLLAGAYSDYVTGLTALRCGLRGLIVSTTYHNDDPPGWLPYEVSKAAKNRFVSVLAHKLREQQVAVVGISPGWMRTELMELHNTPAELDGKTETPHYAARGIVALAGDPTAIRFSGQILDVGELADEYGFTDLDGRQPQWHREHMARLRHES